jgi:hypothetical protein
MRLQYTKDNNDQDILTDETGTHQVMMEWEKTYMERCIQLLKPYGSVLEIGFGMGYSASEILRHDNVTSYTVIDCSPTVWDSFEEFRRKHPKSEIMNLIRGRWQDVLELCGKFDTIFFDDYTYTVDPLRGQEFLLKVLKHHTRIGSRVGFYSSNHTTYENITGIECKCHTFMVDIPDDCRYARGDRMYVPIVTKTSNDNTLVITSPTIIRTPKNVITMIDYIVEDNVEVVLEHLNLDKSKYAIKIDTMHLTCDHHSIVEVGCENSLWTGYVSMNQCTPVTCSLKFYMTPQGQGWRDAATKMFDRNMKDITRWIELSRTTLVYRRMIMFKSDMYHSIHNAFGFDDSECLKILKVTIAEKT